MGRMNVFIAAACAIVLLILTQYDRLAAAPQAIRDAWQTQTSDAKLRPPVAPAKETADPFYHSGPVPSLVSDEVDALNVTATRRKLWKYVRQLYMDYPPPFAELQWPKDWPTMPIYRTELIALDREEIAAASPVLGQDEFDQAREALLMLNDALPSYYDYARLYKGRGYVMSAAGWFLNRCWPVGALMLKQLGSKLPIEVWTKDEEEYEETSRVVAELAASGIQITAHKFSDFLDSSEFPRDYNTNYMMKALAILFCSFEEVILLDADNVPVMLPDNLFANPGYMKHGMILWPDLWPNSYSKTLRDIYNVDYSFERTCESGQVVVDKRRHLDSMVLANYFNWYGPGMFYKLITLDSMGAGDKDTFGFAALALGKNFSFVTTPVELIHVWTGEGIEREEDQVIGRGQMGQRNPFNETEIMFMHSHDPKLNFQVQDLPFDLTFIHSTAKATFWPDTETLEYKLWNGIRWVECESKTLHVKDDPREACKHVRDRTSAMAFKLKGWGES
ncbi:hypothetical protein PYCC9005_003563 [Savitreella phatthalungensis]